MGKIEHYLKSRVKDRPWWIRPENKILKTLADLSARKDSGENNLGCSLHAGSLLLEEVWMLILSSLENSEDMKTAAEVCSTFKRALSTKRKEYLFVDVFPFIHDILDDKSRFNCRRVCHKWKLGVDLHLLAKGENINGRFYAQKHEYFNSLTRITDFLLRMEPLPDNSNPLVTPSVCFSDKTRWRQRDHRMFWKKATEFVTKYGSHIQTFSIATKYPSLLSLCNNIQKLIPLMPGLQRLKIRSDLLANDVAHNVLWPKPITLEHLWYIEVLRLSKDALDKILGLFGDCAGNLRELVIGWDQTADCCINEIPPKFTKLEVLRVKSPIGLHSSLTSLSLGQWPLKTLTMRCGFNSNVVTFQPFFECLSTFSGTLEVLKLSLCLAIEPEKLEERPSVYEENPAQFRQLRLHLPCLVEFELKTRNVRMTSLDFIIGMDNLRRLHLERDAIEGLYDGEKAEGNLIQLGGAPTKEAILASNIWEMVTSLEWLRMQNEAVNLSVFRPGKDS